MTQRSWLWILPIILLAWWLGARELGTSAIWWDEWRTIYRAGGAQYGPLSLSGVLERMLAEDPNQSLGYPMLLSIWGRFVGWTDVAARSFSLLAGIPVVAIMYRLGKEMVSERVGFFAALTLGMSAFFLQYLHEMRTYSIYTLFGALAVWAYWQILKSHRMTWLTGVGLTLSVAGILYMHYLGAVLIAGVGLYHLFFVRKNRLWWGVVGCMALGGVLFIPWLGVMLQAVNAAIEEGGRPDVALTTPQVIDQLSYALTNGFSWLLAPLGGTLLWVIARPSEERQRRAAIFTGFAFVVTLVLTLILHEWLTILAHARYLLVLWVLFPLLVALSVDFLLDRIPAQMRSYAFSAASMLIALTGGWAVFAPTFDAYLLPDAYHVFFRTTLRWDDLADTLKDEVTATDAVAISIDRHTWAVEGAIDFYLRGLPAKYTSLDAFGDDLEDGINSFIAGSPRVWLAREQGSRDNPEYQEFMWIISEKYWLCDTYMDTEGLDLELYARTPYACTPQASPIVQYSQPFTLDHVRVLPESNDDRVKLLTCWSVAPEVPVNTYSVAYYVMDDENTILAQVDKPLPHDDYICNITDIPVGDLAADDYQVTLTVYNWQTGERIVGENSDTNLESDLQPVTTITIAD